MDELLKEFIAESMEGLGEVEALLVQFERAPADASLIAVIFRLVHTIKGTSGFLGLDRLQAIAHAGETLLGRLREGEPPTARSVSLVLASFDCIRTILQSVEATGKEPHGEGGEVVKAIEDYLRGPAADNASGAPGQDDSRPEAVAHASERDGNVEMENQPTYEASALGAANSNSVAPKAAASVAGSSGESIRVSVHTLENIMQLVSEMVLTRNQLLELTRISENDRLKLALQRLSGLTTDLQDSVMRARMQPVARLFSSLPRLVRELSLELNKRIRLTTEGGDTELDRQLIEVIRDPLTHIIRNCADHGIEPPGDRAAAGKPPEGEIRVSASQEAGQFVIEITDDGRGIDVARVKAKAISAGLVRESELAQLSEEEICRFIFEPGFSTASKVTNVSGRGVGMDVVRSNVEMVRGTVSIANSHGRGTRLTMRIPLTLAIAPALIVEICNQRFALPQHSVVEVVEATWGPDGTVKSVQDSLVVDLRGEVMPAVELPRILGLERENSAGREQLIAVLRSSNSSIGLLLDAIVDVQEIVIKPLSRSLSHIDAFAGHTILGDGSVLLILDPAGLARRMGIGAAARKQQSKADGSRHDSTTRLVVFRAGGGVSKVLPASIISRIERVEPEKLKQSEAGLVMLHQGLLIPVVHLLAAPVAEQETIPVLILSIRDRTFGLLVEEIIDIVEDVVDIDLTAQNEMSLGTCRLNGEVIDILDAVQIQDLAYRSGHGGERRGGNVLLLAGDGNAIDLVAPFVQAAGYHVATAKTIEAAQFAASGGSRFDAILLDLTSASTDRQALSRVFELQPGVPLIGLTNGSGADVELGGIEVAAVTDKLDRRQLLDVLSAKLSRVA